LQQASIKNEMQVIKDIRGFIQAETVVPKMVITYNRRKQGVDYLREVMGPLVKKVMEKVGCGKGEKRKHMFIVFHQGKLNLDLNPKLIYQKMITETEIRTGKPSDLPRNVTEEQAMKHEEVRAAVSKHLAELEEICNLFLDGIISSRDKLPYGLRWICKALKLACEAQFPDATQEDIHRLLGYFVYYRFINISIVVCCVVCVCVCFFFFFFVFLFFFFTKIKGPRYLWSCREQGHLR
jgi:Ras GTPase-activating-like protein IQGAP2/3